MFERGAGLGPADDFSNPPSQAGRRSGAEQAAPVP